MKRALPAWLLAALPATLLGHAAAYRIVGESMANAPHAYFGPLLEFSLGLIVVLGLATLVAALLRSGRLAVSVDGTLAGTWVKLALAQTLLFSLLEHSEGYTPSLVGCATQILIALVLAAALVAFGRLIGRCIAIGPRTSWRLHHPTRSASASEPAVFHVHLRARSFPNLSSLR